MVLKHLSKVVVQFSPFTGNSRSAREFLARVTAPKAQASNPDCVVDGRVRIKGSAAYSRTPCHLRTYKEHLPTLSCGRRDRWCWIPSVVGVAVAQCRPAEVAAGCHAGDPFVEVTYKNQKVERIACGSLTVERVMDQINAKSSEMETAEALAAAGLAGVRLRSTFGGAGNTEGAETGFMRKTMPR